MSDPLKINLKKNKINLKLNGKLYSEEEAFSMDMDPEQRKLNAQYESGFKEGYEKALENLENSYNQRLEKKFADMHRILSSVDAKISLYDKEFERVVFQLSFLLTEKIIRREVLLHSSAASVLNEALRKVIGANNILVRLNPSDYENISRESSRLIHTDSFSKIKFETDDRIEQGGCIVETEIGNVDARICSQLNEIKNQFESILNTQQG